jgi:hypothetical protein
MFYGAMVSSLSSTTTRIPDEVFATGRSQFTSLTISHHSTSIVQHFIADWESCLMNNGQRHQKMNII